MGLITNFLVKELAKDVGFQALGKALDISEKRSWKRDDKKKEKLLDKHKKKESSFLISCVGADISFIGSKTKSREYKVQAKGKDILRIKRSVNKDKSGTIKVSDADNRVLATINESNVQSNYERSFVVFEDNNEMGHINVKGDSSFEYVDSYKHLWDIVQVGEEYLISRVGRPVARCRNKGLKLRQNSLLITYNEAEPQDAMLYLAICLFFILDPIDK